MNRITVATRICERVGMLLCLTALLSACVGPTKLERPVDRTRLAAQIDAVLQDSALAQTRTGIKVVSLRTGEVWYERDAHLLFHPASNMKLLTTATALARLGPDFRFRTEVYADSVAWQDSVVAGPLYLKGFADPSLTLEDLWSLVRQLKKRGVTAVTGDLICDETYLDDFYRGAGWMWDDASSSNFALISALTVNRNCVTVVVTPGRQVGDSVRVCVEPATRYVRLENHAVTVDSSDSTRLRAFKVERKWRQRENTVEIRGGLLPEAGPRRYIVEVEEPALFVGTLFAELLAEEGIAFTGQVRKSAVPDSLALLARHLSEPLTVLILHTNKESDNLYAELILKTVGAEVKGPPGSAKKGLQVIREFLQSVGVDSTTLHLADGSGVSRYNVVSPEQIVRLLTALERDFRVQAEFKASLPIAGVDGTLRRRMVGTPAEGRVRAKTGTLRGVSALSGYAVTAGGEPLAFSMIMEHFVGPTSKIRTIQDRILALLCGMR